MSEKRKELLQQLEDLEKEVRTLRQQVNDKDGSAEALFDERQRIGRTIRDTILLAKAERDTRDAITDEVRALKEERNKITAKLNELKTKAQTLDAAKAEAAEKLGIKGGPIVLKKEIDKLQHIIETEGITFEKEKQLMKQIRELEKRYKEAKKASTVWDEARAVNTEGREIRRKSDDLHHQIQEKASQSQQKHEKALALSKQVEDLKAKEDEIIKKIEVRKAELGPVSSQLEEKLKLLADLSEKARVERKEAKIHTDQEHQKKLTDLQAEVLEKLKTGKKLTTDDLRVIQTIPEE